jgi:hypothetical protein
MKEKAKQLAVKGRGPGFWSRWALANLMGLVVGAAGFVALVVLTAGALDRPPGYAFGVALGLTFGPAFGLAQWWVLRGSLGPVGAWVGATVVGFLVAFATIFGVMDGSDPDTSLLVKIGHAVVLGLTLGIAQWSVLRRKLDGASRWILVSVVSWVVAELAGVALTALAGPPLDILGLFAIGTVLPGIAMAWLLDRASSQQAPYRDPVGSEG